MGSAAEFQIRRRLPSMPGGRVYAFGEPENDGERRVIRYLDEHLPGEYRIYHSLERHSAGQMYEWDVLVLAPHAVFSIEVKDWPGRIVGNDREWLLGNNAVRPNPVPLAAKKARILKTRLTERDPFLKAVWVEPVVVIADDRVQLQLAGDCASYVVAMADLVNRLTEPSATASRGSDLRPRLGHIDRILTGDFRPALSSRHIAQFKLVEQIWATDLYTEWRAANQFAPEAPVRLKIYAPDPYLPAAEREAQLNLVSRDFQAASRLGSHPHLRGARDFFPVDGGRYVLVVDDLPGGSLSAELLAGRSLTFEQKLDVAEDVADGLSHAHGLKVVHRDVRPENIWLTPAGAVLTNFDCARVGNGSTVHAMVQSGLDPRYLAPEVRASAASATAASDVFSLGVVLYELLTGFLPSTDTPAEAPSAFDHLIERPLDELLLQMLASEPAARPTAADVCLVLTDLRDRRRASELTPVAPDPGEGEVPEYKVDDTIDGQYLVRTVLGEGSFAKVYRVFHAVTSREYAMKVFRHPGLGLEDAQKEFAALVNLQHPHIVRVWHAALLNSTQHQYFLLTDYVAGRTVQEIIDAGRSAPTQAVAILRDLLDALEYLHSQNFVHRDIKPSNLVVSAEGTWLIDFSIATRATDSSPDGAGTPLYTPPDVVTCANSSSRDLFAAGVVLFQLLTGQHPYGRAPQPGAVPLDPAVAEPRLTPQMAQVLRRAIAPLASDRYSTAMEFLAAVTAVDEPLQPPTPTYPLIENIALEDWEKTKRNYNPYLSRFLTLYSQNRTDNSGTRGYDEVSRATYVRTRLDKRLAPDIIAGKFRLLIITGNAGDGKTAFLQRLEERLVTPVPGEKPVPVTKLASGNGATFDVGSIGFRSNYDGSQDEGNIQNDEVLDEFFSPFRGEAHEVATAAAHISRLIAINEGRLRDFFQKREGDYPWLRAALVAHLDQGTLLPEGYVVVNLNDRSIVAGTPSILDDQIEAFADPAFWQRCESCVYADRCPAKFSADTLNHPDLGPRLKRRLGRLFEIAHLRGRLHLTMRGVRSALAYVLFGAENCDEIGAAFTAAAPGAEHDEDLLARYFYNRLAAARPSGSDAANNQAEEADRLLELLREADVGLTANPEDDGRLHFQSAAGIALIPPVAGRSAYDSELSAAVLERLRVLSPNDLDRDTGIRRQHASLRRKAFFERPDEGWEAMLPYRRFVDMVKAGSGNDNALDDLKTAVIRGVNQLEGFPDIDDALVLRLARDVPGRVRSFRRFPASDFLLRPAKSLASTEYVEYSSPSLEFIYRPGPNGSAARRPTLRLGLDLVELLARMARGYAPTTAERRGTLVNLLVFRTQLAHEDYEQLLLVDSIEQARFHVTKSAGQIELAPVEVTNATR